jgi:hypothetical protein
MKIRRLALADCSKYHVLRKAPPEGRRETPKRIASKKCQVEIIFKKMYKKN